MTQLNAARLRELFRYFPEAGLFMRTKATGRSIRQQPGFVPSSIGGSGYPVIKIDGKLYSCHRLAWLYAHGGWPKFEIDHINGDIKDYRLCNLRDITHAENLQNVRKPRADNKSGRLGVSWCRQTKSWSAHLNAQGVHYARTGFADVDKAHAAYIAMKKKLHPTSTL